MFREKSDRFVFTKVGDKYDFKSVLSYLGKSIPLCPYTNDSMNVVEFPLDFNKQNTLPSNMVHISKSLLQQRDGDMVMASVSHGKFKITLYVPTFALSKEIDNIKKLYTETFNESDEVLINTRPVEALYAMWDALMFNSVKGLFEVKLNSCGVEYSAESQFALGKIFGKIKDREEMGSTTKFQL